MISEKRLKTILILLAIIIICGWLAIIYIQIKNTQQQLAEEKLHNMLYLDVIKKTIANNIFARETIEEVLVSRLEIVETILQDKRKGSSIELQKLCEEYTFEELSFIDPFGKVLASNRFEGIYPYDLSLLEMTSEETAIFTAPPDSSDVYGSRVFIRKREANYFVGAITDSILLNLTRDISLSSMIDFMESSLQDSAVHDHTLYVVIQDTLGIISATSNITSLPRLTDDGFLKEIYQTQKGNSRLTVFKDKTILETATPFILEGYDFGVIRIGTSLYRYEFSRSRKAVAFALFSLIFLACLFLEYIFYRNYKKLQRSKEELNVSRRIVEIARLGGEVAHEIKNPLNSIYMILQRMQLEFEVKDKNDEFEKLLNISYSEMERLNRIIEQFLSFTRKLEVKRYLVNVNRMLSEVTDLFRVNAEQKNVRIRIEKFEKKLFKLDNKLIKQVLINLIKNALEAFISSEGHNEISISAKCHKYNLIISVKDNGSGIPSEDLPRIWNLYFTTKETGNGIGLAVCKKIIESHGGNISVKSVLNKKTEFRIELPGKQEL